MTYNLVLHPNVELKLAEVAMWYEEQVPGLGEDFIRNRRRLNSCFYADTRKTTSA